MSISSLSDIVLPYYARPDLAFTDTIRIVNDTPFASSLYTVPGEFIDIIITLSFGVGTSAAVGNRVVTHFTEDINTTSFYRVPSPASQPPSTTASYTFMSGADSAYSSTDGSGKQWVLAPLPKLPLFPGTEVAVEIRNYQVGDSFGSFDINRIRIPTGPEMQDNSRNNVPFPTPVLL